MGLVFGVETVEEPPFEVLLHQPNGPLSYDIRKYNTRYAAEVIHSQEGGDDSPFRILASYIGVFGSAQNEGSKSISMTAPVVKKEGEKIAMTAPVVKKEGEKIAMTAPVVKAAAAAIDSQKQKSIMQFMLPKEYDDMSKIPNPTNPLVSIKEVPGAVGAVHKYNGRMDDEYSKEMALKLAQQLKEDGVEMDESHVLANYQFWGYNPPFTIPYFRRNEIWIELTKEQADKLINGQESKAE